MREPLSPTQARLQIRAILANGTVDFTRHALAELASDHLDTADALNVLRAGVVEPAEHVGMVWRYRVHTSKMYLVVQFRTEICAVVVTGWRLK
jgi:hypothetical protein